MNLPNALTVLRIFLVPVLVALLLTRTDGGLFLGTAVFGVGVLTDYLDGYFARRRNQVTKLGILLDPLADKLLTTAAFISLVEMNAVPAWMVVIIIGRELAVTGLRNVAAGRGVVIAASGLGKGKMVSQVVSIFLLLLAHEAACPRMAGARVTLDCRGARDDLRGGLLPSLLAGTGAPGWNRGRRGRRLEQRAAPEGQRSSTWSPSMMASLLSRTLAVEVLSRVAMTTISPRTLRGVGTEGYMTL